MSAHQHHSSTGRSRRHLGAGLVATTLVAVGLPLVATSASAVLGSPTGPAAPHSIIDFPSRDFVHLDGYAAAPITVQVLRGGSVVGTTLPFTPNQPDPAHPGAFMADINHAGEPCWSGVTPDLRGGDLIRVLTGPGQGDDTTISGVTVTQKATKIDASTVTVKGTAPDRAAPGGRTPIDQLQSRIVANKQAFVNGGKRTLRAGSIAGGLQGVIAYDSPTSSAWTATFTNLAGISTVDGLSDADRAVRAETRGQWLGRNPLAVNENTIFEFPGGVIFPGPAVGCFAPAASGPSVDLTTASDTGVSFSDNITRITSPTFVGTSALATATSVNLYVDGVLKGSRPVSAATRSYSIAVAGLTAGRHSITAGEMGPSLTNPAVSTQTMGNTPLSVVIDTTGPAVSLTVPAPSTIGIKRLANVAGHFTENAFGSTTRFTMKTATGVPVSAVVTYNATMRTATLNPRLTLLAGTRYIATVASGSTDAAGNPGPAKSWNFVTGKL